MSLLAVCDGCGWTTPVENTGDFGVPLGWVSHALIPAPVKDCGCPLCYRGRWIHTCKTVDRPPFLIYIVGNASPSRWYDWCPECKGKVPGDHVKGSPTSWRVARGAFVLLSITLTFWLWMRLWDLAVFLAHGGSP